MIYSFIALKKKNNIKDDTNNEDVKLVNNLYELFFYPKF